jgi:hypothetical protein
VRSDGRRLRVPAIGSGTCVACHPANARVLELDCIQALHGATYRGQSKAELMTDFHTTVVNTMVPSGLGAAVELRTLTKPCFLPTFLAPFRLLLRRVLPAASRPGAPTA